MTAIATDEAGIAAYFQAGSGIDLARVRGLFRTIERETDTYIIGSVPVGEYPETEDVHVYVDVDGWVMVYYLRADPVSRIFDWRRYHATGHTILSTKLENVSLVVATEAGKAFPGVTYYDFRFPNASHMTLIADWMQGPVDDTFQVNLPINFSYYERSWSYGFYNPDVNIAVTSSRLSLNGVELSYIELRHGAGWATPRQDFLTSGQLSPNAWHTATIALAYGDNRRAYGGLALIYREQ